MLFTPKLNVNLMNVIIVSRQIALRLNTAPRKPTNSFESPSPRMPGKGKEAKLVKRQEADPRRKPRFPFAAKPQVKS